MMQLQSVIALIAVAILAVGSAAPSPQLKLSPSEFKALKSLLGHRSPVSVQNAIQLAHLRDEPSPHQEYILVPIGGPAGRFTTYGKVHQPPKSNFHSPHRIDVSYGRPRVIHKDSRPQGNNRFSKFSVVTSQQLPQIHREQQQHFVEPPKHHFDVKSSSESLPHSRQVISLLKLHKNDATKKKNRQYHIQPKLQPYQLSSQQPHQSQQKQQPQQKPRPRQLQKPQITLSNPHSRKNIRWSKSKIKFSDSNSNSWIPIITSLSPSKEHSVSRTHKSLSSSSHTRGSKKQITLTTSKPHPITIQKQEPFRPIKLRPQSGVTLAQSQVAVKQETKRQRSHLKSNKPKSSSQNFSIQLKYGFKPILSTKDHPVLRIISKSQQGRPKFETNDILYRDQVKHIRPPKRCKYAVFEKKNCDDLS